MDVLAKAPVKVQLGWGGIRSLGIYRRNAAAFGRRGENS